MWVVNYNILQKKIVENHSRTWVRHQYLAGNIRNRHYLRRGLSNLTPSCDLG
eukprot:SAG11_NODE_22051_length_413_cov_0.805732_1_plen_51_part_10